MIPKQQINYDEIVDGTKLDLTSYEEKFKVYDSANPDEKAKYWRDMTLYTYAFFKDKQDKPYRLSAFQDAIAQELLKFDFTPHHPSRFVIFRASNQIGKTNLLCLFAIHRLFNGNNENIVIVSKSLPQSQSVLREIRYLLNTSNFGGWKEAVGDSDNTTMLSIEKDGGKVVNRIICAPSGEGLLGYPVHRLLLDEADFYEEGKNFFWKVAFPRTNQTKGQIILFSNPNPDISKTTSLLWELWTGDLFKRKFHFKFLDAPWNTFKEYEVAKRNSPSHIFASTHDGEFNDMSGAFFSNAEIQDMLQKDWNNVLPITDKPVYISVDLGKMKDNTVICVGIPKKSSVEGDKYKDLDVKYIKKLPLKTEYDKILDEIEKLKKYFDENCKGVAAIGYDATGQKTFGDFAKRRNISMIPVDFSRKESNKTLLYNNFKLMAENRKIKIPYDYDVEKQLAGLEIKATRTNQLMVVENKTSTIHDDIPDSLAILIHISVRPSSVPVSVTRVGHVIEKEKDLNKRESTIKEIEEFRRKEINRNTNSYFEQKALYGGKIYE